MAEKLKIFVQASGRYNQVLAQALIPTLQEWDKDEEVVIINIDAPFEEALVGQTHWPRYKELMRRRIAAYSQIVKQQAGNKILFLDCDVVVLQDCKAELCEILDEADMCLQSPGFNAGIWGVNCTPAAIAFFEQFTDLISGIPTDERQPGYPQFELRDFITEQQENGAINVHELSEDYGWLSRNTKIYHAINGGHSALSKFLVLTIAAELGYQLMGKKFETIRQPIHGALDGFRKYLEEEIDRDDHPRQNIAFHGFLTEDEIHAFKDRNTQKPPVPHPSIAEMAKTDEDGALQIMNRLGYIVGLMGDNTSTSYWPVLMEPHMQLFFQHEEFQRIRSEINDSKE